MKNIAATPRKLKCYDLCGKTGLTPWQRIAMHPHLSLDAAVLAQAKDEAQKSFLRFQEIRTAAGPGFEDFCEDVFEIGRPAWFEDWLSGPSGAEWLASLSVEDWEASAGTAMLYATAGVAPHVDEMTGVSAAPVFFNDGLVFEQEEQRHCTQPGQWFIFDDRVLHAVHSEPGCSVYLAAVMRVRLKDRTYAE